MTEMKHNKYVVEIPELVKKMEEALRRGQMERFQALSKERSRSLHELCAERQTLVNSGELASVPDEETAPGGLLGCIDEILKQAIDDNHKLINEARRAASATQEKIAGLASRKKSTLRLAHGYGHGWVKLFSAGNAMSLKG